MSRKVINFSLLRLSPSLRRFIHNQTPQAPPSKKQSSIPEWAESNTKLTPRNTINVIRDDKDTDPETQKATAGLGNEVNPLEMSPANLEASEARREGEGQPERGVEKVVLSKKVSPPKGKVVGGSGGRTGSE
ncbi:hypothetical protein EJ08DRAFT_692546 [Tothia fuscella]|uniref:Uncharacterized protein n=1 Tax=Tothia fuscella TaxID=1048955 RepID=A0A9P4NZD3_9PEZI|nr:hypothetical protein EJ08DRAFT_692546 [Tothia fuscella]